MKKTIIRREDGEAYLIRRTLFTCKWFSIKLHRILLSDPSCPHDHPWAFISVILWGGYIEHTEKGSKVYAPGAILFRKAAFVHRLELFSPATTLVITFKKSRQWGFVTKNGWKVWYNYNYQETCD